MASKDEDIDAMVTVLKQQEIYKITFRGYFIVYYKIKKKNIAHCLMRQQLMIDRTEQNKKMQLIIFHCAKLL